jgi:putative membrane protein
MDEKRLFTFGIFEFSLAVFAVIAGLFQYAETFASIELFEIDRLTGWLTGTGGFLSGLGIVTQIVSLLAGLLVFFVIGSITGLVRVFLRDWDFVLERTEKGFRRRRGMFTKTDVVMPVHRVQAINVTTGFIRRRFGWHGLKFVSLAQDSGSASHDVAPFATMAELSPIAAVAGFAVEPAEGTQWQRGSRNYRIDSAVIEFAILALIATGVGTVLAVSGAVSPAWAGVILLIGALLAARQMFLWRYDFNAIDAARFFVRRGWLAPRLDVASRVKLQSVEIARGPIARRRGYATLKLGLAGGTLEFEGLPVERARQLREAILASIAHTDFSELNG